MEEFYREEAWAKTPLSRRLIRFNHFDLHLCLLGQNFFTRNSAKKICSFDYNPLKHGCHQMNFEV